MKGVNQVRPAIAPNRRRRFIAEGTLRHTAHGTDLCRLLRGDLPTVWGSRSRRPTRREHRPNDSFLSQLLLGRGTSTRLARGVLGAAPLVAGSDVEEDNFERHDEGLQYWPPELLLRRDTEGAASAVV